jgi:hypothetical protein
MLSSFFVADWLASLQAMWQECAVNIVYSAYSGDCTLDKHQKMICRFATFELTRNVLQNFSGMFSFVQLNERLTASSHDCYLQNQAELTSASKSRH